MVSIDFPKGAAVKAVTLESGTAWVSSDGLALWFNSAADAEAFGEACLEVGRVKRTREVRIMDPIDRAG